MIKGKQKKKILYNLNTRCEAITNYRYARTEDFKLNVDMPQKYE